MVWIYLLMSFGNAAPAVLKTNDRLFHAIFAGLFALGAMAFWLKKQPPPVDASIP